MISLDLEGVDLSQKQLVFHSFLQELFNYMITPVLFPQQYRRVFRLATSCMLRLLVRQHFRSHQLTSAPDPVSTTCHPCCVVFTSRRDVLRSVIRRVYTKVDNKSQQIDFGRLKVVN